MSREQCSKVYDKSSANTETVRRIMLTIMVNVQDPRRSPSVTSGQVSRIFRAAISVLVTPLAGICVARSASTNKGRNFPEFGRETGKFGTRSRSVAGPRSRATLSRRIFGVVVDKLRKVAHEYLRPVATRAAGQLRRRLPSL